MREAAGTAASAAAAALLSRLRAAASYATVSSGASVGSSRHTVDAQQLERLLAAAASPATSEDPHGVEAGCMSQILLEIIIKVRILDHVAFRSHKAVLASYTLGGRATFPMT